MGGMAASINDKVTGIFGDKIGGALVKLNDPLDIAGGQAFKKNEDMVRRQDDLVNMQTNKTNAELLAERKASVVQI